MVLNRVSIAVGDLDLNVLNAQPDMLDALCTTPLIWYSNVPLEDIQAPRSFTCSWTGMEAPFGALYSGSLLSFVHPYLRTWNLSTMLPSSAQFQSLFWLWVNFVSLVTYLQSVNYIWPELELELELILTIILELKLELNPKTVAGIGIGINSIFYWMTRGLSLNMWSSSYLRNTWINSAD